ncbi:MAG: NADP-dependent oxidoreductase [Jatrophihabitans sp.]
MSRAVRFDHYGGVDVLHVVEVDEPVPAEGQVVVAVVASSINPGEIAIREGAMDEQWPATFPSGQGSDLAGRVHAIGPGVTGWQAGDDVIGWTDNRDAQADFVAVPADQITMRPPATLWDQAACLHVAGCTAYGLVRTVDAKSGETVVVAGAAGGVGCAAVQLLRACDVRVLGVAGNANDDWLRSVGAEPVNYGAGLGHRLRDAAPEGIDAVIDAFGGGYVEQAVGALRVAPGRVATCIDFEAAEKFDAKGVYGANFTAPAVLAELAEDAADGELTFPIAATYPLEHVRDAYEQLAKRHTRGKIVLQVQPAPS